VGEFDYGIDKHFWEFPVRTDETDLVVREDTTGDGSYDTIDTISVRPRFYFNHLSLQSSFPLSRDGFLRVVEKALNFSSTLTGSYTIDPFTPPVSTGTNQLPKSGIKIEESNATPFQLDFADASSTINQRYLGWVFEKAASSTLASGRFSDVERITSPFSLPGAMVREERAHDEQSAKLARVPWNSPSASPTSRSEGDINNAWETLCYRMLEPKMDTGEPRRVIVKHDATSFPNTLDHRLDFNNFFSESDIFELYQFRPEQRNGSMTPRDFWDIQSKMGEFYKIEWDAQVVENYFYRQ